MKSFLKIGIENESVSRSRTLLMGFSILLVVLFHSAIPAPESFLPRVLWYLFVSFGGGLGVNVFFILSGFGLAYSHFKTPSYGKNGQYAAFFRKRLLRVFVPYLLVAVVYYGILDLAVQFDVLKFLKDVTLLNFVLDGDRTYWYIFASLLFYAVFPLLMWASDKFGTVRAHLVAGALTVAAEFVFFYALPDFYARFEVVILRFLSFIVGSFVGRLILEKRMPKPNLWLTAGGVFVLFGAALLLIRMHLLDERGQRYLFIPLAFLTVYLLSYLFDKIPYRIRSLDFAGRYSLEIYLLHIAVAGVPSLVFAWLGRDKNPYGAVVLVAAISVAVGLLLKKVSGAVTSKLEKKK